MVGPGPAPGPYVPAPGWDFPAAATPGSPPPPLPASDAGFLEPIHDLPGPVVDPALVNGLRGLVSWHARVTVAPSPQWSTATLAHAAAPMRHTPPGPGLAFFEEPGLRITVAALPEDSLPDAPPGTPMLSRLRMVHRKLLPPFARLPLDAQWLHLGRAPAVLDRFGMHGGRGRLAGFSLAAEVAPGQGLVAVGSGPPDRDETLHRVALPLATLASGAPDPVRWAALPGWSVSEELQVTTPSALALVRLEPLAPGHGLAQWTDHVFARGQFLRDRRTLGERPVRVRGLAEAYLWRFDWQPPGSGRALTTVVTGVTDRDGFSLTLDVPLQGADLLLDPDGLLELIEVRPAVPPTPLMPPPPPRLPSLPAPTPAPSPAPTPASTPAPAATTTPAPAPATWPGWSARAVVPPPPSGVPAMDPPPPMATEPRMGYTPAPPTSPPTTVPSPVPPPPAAPAEAPPVEAPAAEAAPDVAAEPPAPPQPAGWGPATAPAPPPAATPTAFPSAGGEAEVDRFFGRLHAAVDRVVVAAVDIADGDHDRVLGPDPEKWKTTGDDDGAALRRALIAVLGPIGGIRLPWHDLADLDRLVGTRLEQWEVGADALRQEWIRTHDGAPLARVWSTARQIVTAADQAREQGTAGEAGLAYALERSRRHLDDDRDAAWDDALTTFFVARPQRYALKALLDAGSGHLVWAINETARARWDYPVDHFDLPIPVALARRVQELIDRHDQDVSGVAAVDRPFEPQEREQFLRECRRVVADLRRALGPAYTIEDRFGDYLAGG
jgi:hypothetical protein